MTPVHFEKKKKPTMGGFFGFFVKKPEKTRVGWAFSKKVGFLPTLANTQAMRKTETEAKTRGKTCGAVERPKQRALD